MKLTKQQIEYAFTRIENIVTDRVNKKARKVKDKIMLSGDAEAALKLIEAYAAEA